MSDEIQPGSHPSPRRMFDGAVSLEEAVGLAIGAGSVAWEKAHEEEVFDTAFANEIRRQLIEWINDNRPMVDPTHSKGEKIVLECLQNEEPFFVFRARDIFTIMVLRKYAQLVDEFGPNDFEFSEGVHDMVDRVRDWQRNNPRSVRYPD